MTTKSITRFWLFSLLLTMSALKIQRAHRTCKEFSSNLFDNNWVNDYITEFKKEAETGNKFHVDSWHTLFSKRSSTAKEESGLSVVREPAENLAEVLDPTNCCHPQCSFAYNVTGDIKRSSLVVESVPLTLYQRLAALWNLDPQKLPRFTGNKCKSQTTEEEDLELEEFMRNIEKDLQMRTDISQDLHVNVSTDEGSVINFEGMVETREAFFNSLSKKDSHMDSKSKKQDLQKKASKITKMIIRNFLEWYQSLGGNDGETFLEESTLQELFQIGFDMAAAKAVAIRIKELPTVPETLANLRNEPKHATRYGLKQLLKRDIKMENIPLKMFGFGSMLPKEKPSLRYKPPRNLVKKTWMECSRVPGDLDTMKTVWGGLERLRSTIAFSNWLKNHPDITPPTYLKEKGLLEINYEEWNQLYKGFEMDADNLEVIVSDMKVLKDKSSSTQEIKPSETNISHGAFGSYDSF